MATLTVSPTSYSVTDKDQNTIEVNFVCDKVLTDVKLSLDNGITYKNKLSMTQTSAIFDIAGVSNNNYNCKLKGHYDKDGTPIPVESVSLSKTSHTFTTEGDSLQLNTTVLPADAANKNVTWRSSNSVVATVVDGYVVARANGVTTITCTTEDGNKTATCNITVSITSEPSYEFDVVSKTYTGKKNGVVDIEGICTYPDIDYWEVTSDESWIGIANTFTDGKFQLELPAFLGVGTYTNCYMEAKRNAKDTVVTTSKNKFTLVVEEQGGSTVPVTSVSLSKTSHGFAQADETLQLTATVAPSNSTNKAVTWSSSNTSVTTVSSSGLVTAKTNGSATITVSTTDGNKKATCSVVVDIVQGDTNVTSVSLDQKTMTINNGQTKELIATVLPTNATNKRVTWSSDNRSIVDVGHFGEVMCFGDGGATITVTTQDGGFTDKCVVNGGADGGGSEPPPPIPQPSGKMYRSVAFALEPWKDYYPTLSGLDMFKDYNYGSALLCIPVDCSFADNSPFTHTTEADLSTLCNKVESLGLMPILKMHTVSLVEDGQGNQDKPQNAQTWFSNYRVLVNKFADIVVKRGYKEFIISNEMHNVMNLASNKSYMAPIISDVKAKGLKVSMSMNTPEVRENDGFQFFDELDFYCMNTYPQLTKNGVAWARDNFEALKEGFYTPLSSMDVDYGSLFKNMGGSNNLHKEIWLTEVGCINRTRGLEYPAYWGQGDARDDEVQELWLKAVFDVLENDKKSGKLTDRVTRYMLWDGNSDSDFNPVNKRGKSVLDTYWKDETVEPPPVPEDTNYFDINSTLAEEKGCTHTVNKSNKTITVNSDFSANFYGYLIWDTSKIREGRRYRLTCKSSNDKTFVRFRVNGSRIIEDSFKTEYSIDFTGVDTQEKITDICLGIRHPDNTNIGLITSIFSDIKIVDLDGDPGDPPTTDITFDVIDYKIIVKKGSVTESYHSNDDIPRNLNGVGGVDGYKMIIKDRIKHYLALTNGSSSSHIVVDGKKPFNYSVIDQAFKNTWSNRGYAVKNNTLKYTIANRKDNDDYGITDDRPINAEAFEKGLKIYNCAIPGYMQITQDSNSVNSVSEASFDDNFLGICRLYQGEKFHVHQNTRLLGGFNNNSRFYISVLVHELGHTTGIWDNSPHYPTTYTYNKEDREAEWLQPSDIAHIKDKFPHLTGGSRNMQEVEKTNNNSNIVFNFRHYLNEDEMLECSNKVIFGTFDSIGTKYEHHGLVYNVYNFKVDDEIVQINVHESFDLKLEKNKKYKAYINEFNYLLNPNQTIIEIE